MIEAMAMIDAIGINLGIGIAAVIVLGVIVATVIHVVVHWKEYLIAAGVLLLLTALGWGINAGMQHLWPGPKPPAEAPAQ